MPLCENLNKKFKPWRLLKQGQSFLKNIHPHNDIKWEDLLPHFRKGVSVSSWKNSCLPYSRSRAVCHESFPSPSHKNKLQPIDVFHLHLSDKRRIFRSNLSTKYLYICQRVLFKETVDKLHSAYLCKDRSASWSMVLDLVIQWKKDNLLIGGVRPLHVLTLTPLLLLTVGQLAFSSSNACCKSACQHNKLQNSNFPTQCPHSRTRNAQQTRMSDQKVWAGNTLSAKV